MEPPLFTPTIMPSCSTKTTQTQFMKGMTAASTRRPMGAHRGQISITVCRLRNSTAVQCSRQVQHILEELRTTVISNMADREQPGRKYMVATEDTQLRINPTAPSHTKNTFTLR